jgi:DNA polymerase-3 subunit alpha
MFDMFDLEPPAADRKPAADKPAGPVMPLSDKLQYEKELLGFYVSGHPMNPYRHFAAAIDTFTGGDWQKMENREPFRICGVITGVTRKIARKDNRPWAVITLATTRDTYTVNAFANCYGDHHSQCEVGNLVLVEGQVMRRQDDEVQLAANSLRPLDAAVSDLVKGLTFIISGNGHSSEFIQLLRSELEKKMGETPVRLGIDLGNGQVAVADLASSLNWDLNKDQFQVLRRHPAVRDVSFVVPQPQAPEPKWARKR